MLLCLHGLGLTLLLRLWTGDHRNKPKAYNVRVEYKRPKIIAIYSIPQYFHIYTLHIMWYQDMLKIHIH